MTQPLTRRLLEKRGIIYLLVLCVFAGGLAVTGYLYRLDRQKQAAHLRDQTLQRASAVRVAIEQQLNTSLNLTMGLVVYVATHPDISQAEFAAIAARILERARFIRNIGLARDNVISHIYPLEGNRKALGARLLEIPDQRAAALRAIETRNSVIAGPVALVQGGTAFISRIPIFLDQDHTRLWGLTSVVMNVDTFLQEAQVGRYDDVLRLALRGKDSLGEGGDVFYGDAALFERPDAVLLPITLPQGYWLLAAAPRDGWQMDTRRSAILLGAGAGATLLVGLLLYALLDLLVALSRANQRAEEASAHKARFFTHMTHELRTPLTAIQGVVALLASGKLRIDPEQTTGLLQNALRNCQRLQWIINDMLDLKKLESGAVELAREPLALSDVIGDALDGIEQIARKYAIELKLDNRVDESVRILADRARLQQVMLNLLSNAIKYSPERSRVTINAFEREGRVRVEIVDQGPGVSEDQLGTIFEEFGQDKPSTRNDVASTGLGLTISRQIIERHRGSIGCRNLATGGCCFHIELPVVPAA